MSYFQCNDYYRLLLKTGRLPIPYPYHYPYQSPAPNLSGDSGCRQHYYGTLPYDYYYCNDYCSNSGVSDPAMLGPEVPSFPPMSFNQNNLCYRNRDICEEKYDYHCYDKIPFQDPSSALCFTVQRLVSNVPCAVNLDTNLLDPWGIIIMGDIVRVVNSGTGLITSYNLVGEQILPPINVFGPVCNIAQPTGIACNCDCNSFIIVKGPLRASSSLIITTRDGTINGYNASIDPCNSILLIDSSANNSVYTGIAVVNITSNLFLPKNKSRCATTVDPNLLVSSICCRNNIYAADFYNQRIDVFDGNLNKITTYPFIDENTNDPIPENFAPYNIVNIGDYLYVTYAKQNPDNSQYEFFGPGCGFISIFTYEGVFVRRFASRGSLNSPWGLILAPTYFSYPAGSIMVGNYGNGTISIFDCDGTYINSLNDSSNNTICLAGLRGLALNPNYARILYWTANDKNLSDACMGSINTRLII